jgi:hypothetical protein
MRRQFSRLSAAILSRCWRASAMRAGSTTGQCIKCTKAPRSKKVPSLSADCAAFHRARAWPAGLSCQTRQAFR